MAPLPFIGSLLALAASLLPRPVGGPAARTMLLIPPGWEYEYLERSLRAREVDGSGTLELRLDPYLGRVPADGELLAGPQLRGAAPEGGFVCLELGQTYARVLEYRRGNRWGLYAALYAHGWLWHWSYEAPAGERDDRFAGALACLAGVHCRLPQVLAREPLDFSGELTLRIGPGFRLGLPEDWILEARGDGDFLAVLKHRGATVADIAVTTTGPAAGRDDRALYLESLLLDMETRRDFFQLLTSTPTELGGFPAQLIRGRLRIDGFPLHWRCAVLFGRQGTYAVTGTCAETHQETFDELLLRVAESLREGALTPWYEELWFYLLEHATTLLIPLIITVLAGVYFGLHYLRRLFTYIGLWRERRGGDGRWGRSGRGYDDEDDKSGRERE